MKYILLVLSWPVCLIHRYWNHKPPHNVHWFIMDVRKPDESLLQQDVQYYIADTGNLLSTSLILLSFLLFTRKGTRLRLLAGTIFAISLSDIIHYWLCFKQMEMIVYLQGLAMIIVTLYIALKPWRKDLKSGRPL